MDTKMETKIDAYWYSIRDTNGNLIGTIWADVVRKNEDNTMTVCEYDDLINVFIYNPYKVIRE